MPARRSAPRSAPGMATLCCSCLRAGKQSEHLLENSEGWLWFIVAILLRVINGKEHSDWPSASDSVGFTPRVQDSCLLLCGVFSVADLERGRNCGKMCALGLSKSSAAEFSFDSFGKSRTHGVIKNLLNESSNRVHCSLSFSLFSRFPP